MDGKAEGAKQQALFFSKLEETRAKIFEDPGTKLEFVRENFEFYINPSDGRRFTFNQLSAGFSAFLSILTELLMRTDLLRKQASDYTNDPCGFVLIDEPETHLHLEMQYQILPLLTSLFPISGRPQSQHDAPAHPPRWRLARPLRRQRGNGHHLYVG